MGKIESLHKHIGIVNQTPDLFQGSLADNIRYGSAKHAVDTGDEDEAEITAAAKLANCIPFIEKFRAKFDTFAGSKGGNYLEVRSNGSRLPVQRFGSQASWCWTKPRPTWMLKMNAWCKKRWKT